ncbi:MAG: hypothetical protein JO056_03340 [Alphaproteobacteria bacterium]|nr:hypothetical protein [Alphaproteobacteria bacterium]
MTIAAEFQTLAQKEAAHDVPLWRLYLLRLLYGAIAFLMGMQIWPIVLQHGTMTVMRGVAFAMLAALSAVAILGLRYPLKMLPLLFFELMWKAIWLAAFALPEALKGPLGPDMMETVINTSVGIVVPLVLPWRYVFANYVKKPGDRWR